MSAPIATFLRIPFFIGCVLLLMGSPLSAETLSVQDAHLFLQQSTFGPTQQSIQRLRKLGKATWLKQQFEATSAYSDTDDGLLSHYQLTEHIAQEVDPAKPWFQDGVFNPEADNKVLHYQMAAWWEHSVATNKKHTRVANNQLRQRVAYALSQLLVVSSGEAPLHRRAEGLAWYYDLLAQHAFGNYRELLGAVSRSPAMGVYLSHRGNQKTVPNKALRPDENYARELMQLFSLSLYELNVDGSPNYDGKPETVSDKGDVPIPVYDQTDIEELAKVLTGWELQNQAFGKRGPKKGNYAKPMVNHARFHEQEAATQGDGIVYVLGQPINLRKGSAEQHLDQALDIIYSHPNVGPHVSTHLIQQLVTNNPSAAYIARVSKVFNDNGQGVRGDLQAVLTAILLDDEAAQAKAKVKEPLLAFTQLLRAFDAQPFTPTALAGQYFTVNRPERVFGQAPLRSPTVFNFYDSNFTPSNAYFKRNDLVEPVMEINAGEYLYHYNNLVYRLLFEKDAKKVRHLANTPSENVKGAQTLLPFYIDFKPWLIRMERYLEGDSNGDFASIKRAASSRLDRRTVMIEKLLNDLALLMLGNTLTETESRQLARFLHSSVSTNRGTAQNQALQILQFSIYYIATSAEYRVQ